MKTIWIFKRQSGRQLIAWLISVHETWYRYLLLIMNESAEILSTPCNWHTILCHETQGGDSFHAMNFGAKILSTP
jgi:hypothetical protein